jgi:hypothetical protein
MIWQFDRLHDPIRGTGSRDQVRSQLADCLVVQAVDINHTRPQDAGQAGILVHFDRMSQMIALPIWIIIVLGCPRYLIGDVSV